MIYEFRSRATGTVVMTAKVAERLLGLIGKPAGPQGIITVAQLPEAIARLQTAIAEERHARERAREAVHQAVEAGAAAAGHDEDDAGASQAIPLETRAQPLIEMFERSLAAGRDITWGV